MNPLPPVPRPDITQNGNLKPPWQAWFNQLYNYLTAAPTGGGGLVPNTRQIITTSPLAGGGTLAADRTLSINVNGITNSYLAQMASSTIKGNATGGTANAQDLTGSQVKTLLAISLSTDVSGTLQAAQFPALTGDVTTTAGSLATTIAANAVTNAKAAQMATLTIKGNNTGGASNPLDLTVSQVKTMLSVAAGANPTALVTLAAVNGVSTSFMRADAAPALDVSISPTWTGAHTFSQTITGIAAVNGNLGVQAAGVSLSFGRVLVAGSAEVVSASPIAVGTNAAALLGLYTNAVLRVTIGSAGNVTIAAVASGDTLTVAPSATSGALMASSSALTTGAGAGAGTITNAPSAGNPTKWIKINDAGTIRSVPAW